MNGCAQGWANKGIENEYGVDSGVGGYMHGLMYR